MQRYEKQMKTVPLSPKEFLILDYFKLCYFIMKEK